MHKPFPASISPSVFSKFIMVKATLIGSTNLKPRALSELFKKSTILFLLMAGLRVVKYFI